MAKQDRINRSGKRNQNNIAESVHLQTRKHYGSFRDSESILSSQKQKKITKINTRLISGILSLILGISAAAFTFVPYFRVQTPAVTGSTQINIEEITYYTGLRNLPIYMVDPEMIRDSLLKRYPEIRDIHVTLVLPSSVDIVMEQRNPVIEWDFGGSTFWIDEDGTVMKESSSQSKMVYVLANSFPGAKSRTDRNVPASFSRKALNSILHFGSVLPEGKTLFYSYDNGFGWDTNAGYRLWLGINDNGLDEKLAMAESLKKYFAEEEIEPDMLSLEFMHAPYYRFSE